MKLSNVEMPRLRLGLGGENENLGWADNESTFIAAFDDVPEIAAHI